MFETAPRNRIFFLYCAHSLAHKLGLSVWDQLQTDESDGIFDQLPYLPPNTELR